jgi:hypothetical protein
MAGVVIRRYRVGFRLCIVIPAPVLISFVNRGPLMSECLSFWGVVGALFLGNVLFAVLWLIVSLVWAWADSE